MGSFLITLNKDEDLAHPLVRFLCLHRDAWLAEPDDGPGDNYWIVGKLLEKYPDKMVEVEGPEGPHYDDSWWIGAKSESKHDDHNPGVWRWEKLNTTVEWFDWAPGQPNDYHRQQCLSYVRYDYFGDNTYQWNDLDCESNVADYICEKLCDKEP